MNQMATIRRLKSPFRGPAEPKRVVPLLLAASGAVWMLAFGAQAQEEEPAPDAETPGEDAAAEDASAGDASAGDASAGDASAGDASAEDASAEGASSESPPDREEESSGLAETINGTKAKVEGAIADTLNGLVGNEDEDTGSVGDDDASEEGPGENAETVGDRSADSATPEGTESVPGGCPECDCDCEEEEPAKEKEPVDPNAFKFVRELTLGATGNFLFNNSFVGQADGLQLQVGAVVDGKLGFSWYGVKWMNTLKMQETISTTPIQVSDFALGTSLADKLVKAGDNLSLTSRLDYQYVDFPWLGPYAQASVETLLLPTTSAFFADPTIARKVGLDGTIVDENIKAGGRTVLGGTFAPTVFKEELGGFVEPLNIDPWIKLEGTLALGGQHTFGLGAFVPKDDASTAGITEFVAVPTTHSIGPTIGVTANGAISKVVTWKVFSKVFYPVFYVGGPEFDLIQRIHLDAGANLSVKLTDYLSLDWVNKVVRVPFIVDAWQVQSQLLITAGFNILGGDEEGEDQ